MTRTILAIILELLLASIAQSQWLSDAEQQHNAALWAWTGVEMPKGMKFYKCQPCYQDVARGSRGEPVYLLCSADYRLHSEFKVNQFGQPIERVFEANLLQLWRRPGGLHGVDRSGWRNATAVYLPNLMSVWQGTIKMPGAGTLPIVRWSYPDGTIFADLLIRKQGDMEWPFELRLREKVDGKWDDGVAYRPYGSVDELPPGSIKRTWKLPAEPGAKLELLGVKELTATAYVLPRLTGPPEWKPFRPSRIVATCADNDGPVPMNFSGNPVRCTSCHQNAGVSAEYASVIRGDDTILSFHPFEPSSISNNGVPREVRFNPEVTHGLPTGKVKAPGGGPIRQTIIGGKVQ